MRQFLAWLADGDTEGDPLNDRDARDWAVRDYRSHLQTVLKRKPATVNNALAAVDDLYIRRGLGPVNAARAELPRTAPKALSTRAAVRFLREVQRRPSPRDRAIALVASGVVAMCDVRHGIRGGPCTSRVQNYEERKTNGHRASRRRAAARRAAVH